MPLWSVAESSSWYVETAGSGWEALERIQSGTVPDLLVLDLSRGDADSLHVVRWFHRIRPELPIILLSHEEERSREREALRLGAQDFVVRPFDEQRLENVIRRYLTAPVDASLGFTSENVEQLGEDGFFVGASPAMQKLRAQAELLAQADVPVLIVGEPGSGRDTAARLIHKLSVRSGFRFLKVNCGALPGDLLEKELFGHSTIPIAGSELDNPGKLELSQRGTLFLDDIAETPLHVQEKLLHVIEEKQVSSAGNGHGVDVDVRILAAADIMIERAPANGKLREDLYYRLSAFTVHVPSLRQRRDEIPLLLRHFMHKLARHYGLAEREFSPTVLDACQRHPWPGNVRELESFVKRYLMVGDSTVHQSGLISTPLNASQSLRLASGQTGKSKSNSDEFAGSKSLKSLINDVKAETERTAIAAALERTGWNRKAAARLLKISYRTLLYKIEQYGMSASNSLPLSFINGSGNGFGVKGNGYPLKGNGKTE
jgi:two-component system, NtrC family, response regulator AtoC